MRKLKLFQTIFGSRKTTTVRFTVQGMDCGSCVERVEQAVRQLPGIASIRVDLPTGDVAVEYEPKKITPEQICERIVATGYAATECSQQ